MIRHYIQMQSPIGSLLLTSDGAGLSGVYMEAAHRPVMHTHAIAAEDAVLAQAKQQLGEYFAGERSRFDVPLAEQGTPFQQSVWAALRGIEFGATRSYGELAAQLGVPTASRAVGMANGRNPISVIVPCHRVIGANGRLTGYAGGLERKQWLLTHEATVGGLRLS